jgi:hypothetical protein
VSDLDRDVRLAELEARLAAVEAERDQLAAERDQAARERDRASHERDEYRKLYELVMLELDRSGSAGRRACRSPGTGSGITSGPTRLPSG